MNVDRTRIGYVYFARRMSDGLIKIGYSYLDPYARLEAIYYRDCCDVEKLGLMRGSLGTEADIHGRFVELRAYGEWFRPEQSLLDFIASETRNWDEMYQEDLDAADAAAFEDERLRDQLHHDPAEGPTP